MKVGAAISQTKDAGLATVEAADAAAQPLGETPCRLALVFTSPHHAGDLGSVGAAVEARLAPEVLLGAASQGVVGPDTEVEDEAAVVVWCAGWDGGELRPFRTWAQPHGEQAAAIVGWPDTEPGDLILLLADPRSYPAGQVIAHLGEHRADQRVVGGMVTPGQGAGQLLGPSEEGGVTAHEGGAVGVVLRDVPVQTIVSQGCRPVGKPFVVTRAERNIVHELAGAPAAERLKEVFAQASAEDRRLMQSGLHVGFVADEYRDEFATGDFLVRTVLGADDDTGAIAVGDVVEVGQTLQFQVRDAASAHEDLLAAFKGRRTDPAPVAGALLFTCNGRGQKFFHEEHHDARLVGEQLTDRIGGAFCAGEIGPVGGRSFLHGFTASLAVFHEPERPPGD